MKKRDWILIGFVLIGIAILAGTTFFSDQYDNVYSILPLRYFILYPSILAIVLYSNKRRWLRRTANIVCAVAWALCIGAYLLCFPEYTAEKAYQIVSADPAYAHGEVIHTGAAYLDPIYPNPLYQGGYNLTFSSDTETGNIFFDMVSGEYHYVEMN